MKKLFPIIFFALVAQVVFGQKVTIKGTITDSPDFAVLINTPVDGKIFNGQNAEVKVTTAGTYSYTFMLTKPGFVTVVNNFYKVSLYVEPNQIYEVNYNEKNKLHIDGYMAEGQRFINALGIMEDPKMQMDEIFNLKGADSKLKYAQNLENQKLQKVEEAFKNKKITQLMYKGVIDEVKNWVSLLLATDFYFTYREFYESEQKGTEFMKDYGQAWEKLYDNIDKKEFLSSPNFSLIMARYTTFLEIKESGKIDYGKSGVYQINNINLYKNKVKAPFLEYAWANAIVDGINSNKFEPEWKKNFAEFKKTFQKSKLTPMLSLYVEKVIVYNDNLKKNNPNVKFMPNADKLKTIEELFATLKGKVTYIDFWATWCGPCRKELQYSKKNHEELAQMGVQTVYISIDKEREDQAWRDMTKSNALEGLNGRINDALTKELYRKAPDFSGIPYYIILDKEGNPAVWNAKHPSEKNDLFEQIRQVIK